MKTLQLLLLSLTALAGCNKTQDTGSTHYGYIVSDTTTIKVMNTDTISYLALGDSYTVGEAEPQDKSFPYQLTDGLKQIGFKAQNPLIIATTGWTTEDLLSNIATTNLTKHNYSFVTLLIGVNDQYQGKSQDSYRKNFVQLLTDAIEFAGGDVTRVFVLSIPDYGVTPFANGQDAVIGPQIDAFNAINKQESTNAHVNYLDITAISREAAYNPLLIAPDGLHPSDKMYTEWVQNLMPLVIARINKK